jgi:hypothetical protein
MSGRPWNLTSRASEATNEAAKEWREGCGASAAGQRSEESLTSLMKTVENLYSTVESREMIIITIRDDLRSSLEMRLDNKHTGGVRHRPANTFENTFAFRGGSSV